MFNDYEHGGSTMIMNKPYNIRKDNRDSFKSVIK